MTIRLSTAFTMSYTVNAAVASRFQRIALGEPAAANGTQGGAADGDVAARDGETLGHRLIADIDHADTPACIDVAQSRAPPAPTTHPGYPFTPSRRAR